MTKGKREVLRGTGNDLGEREIIKGEREILRGKGR